MKAISFKVFVYTCFRKKHFFLITNTGAEMVDGLTKNSFDFFQSSIVLNSSHSQFKLVI